MSKKLASPITFKLGLKGGWELHFEYQALSYRVEVRTKLLRNGRIATKREEEFWRDTTPFVGPLLVKELSGLPGEKKIPAKLADWIDQYKKATSLCRSGQRSPERRKGAGFFEFWRLETLAAQESGQKISDSGQITLLGPLLVAFSELNAEFVRGAAEAMPPLRASSASTFWRSSGEEPYFAVKSSRRPTPTFDPADVQKSGMNICACTAA
jgi:hypothetical protein